LDEVPPATLIGVSLLGYEDQLVEIDAIIVRKPSGAYKGRCRPTLSANVGRLDREVGPSVVKVAENAEREQRIIYEVVVDAYGPEERALGWFYYAEERMSFPFQGRCTTTRSISPLKESEEVVVLGLAEEDECMNELFVRVEWQGRDLAVPLSQLVSIDGDVDTEQVIEDWRYWNHRGYIY
jgi:hypothetical protein